MKIGIINNPLTVTGVFATISQVVMTSVMKNMNENILRIFIWFVIIFPLVLLVFNAHYN